MWFTPYRSQRDPAALTRLLRIRVAGCGAAVREAANGGAGLDTVVIACPQDAYAMQPRISAWRPE